MKLLVSELEVWMQFYTTLNLLPRGCLSGKPNEIKGRWQKAATGVNLMSGYVLKRVLYTTA